MTEQQTPDDLPIASPARCQVFASGRALPGFTIEQVQQQLEQRLKLPTATAARLLAGKPVQLKREIDTQTADEYCRRLRSIGLDVEIQTSAAIAVSAPIEAPAPEPSPVASAPASDDDRPADAPIDGPLPIPHLIPTTLRVQLLAQTLRLLATPVAYALLPVLVLAAVVAYAAYNSQLILTPPLFFSLPVYLLPIVGGLLLTIVLLRPLLPLIDRVEDAIPIERAQEPQLYIYIKDLCTHLDAAPPQSIHLDLSSRVQLRPHSGRDGWQRGLYDLRIGLPLLLNAEPATLNAALASELIFARDAALLRRHTLIGRIRHWLRRHSQPQRDVWSQRLSRVPDNTVAPLLARFEQWTQHLLGKLFQQLDARSSHSAEQTLLAISDRAAIACSGAGITQPQLLLRYRLDHAKKRALTKNNERRIDRRPIENLAPLIGFYYEQGDAEHRHKLDRTIESGAAAQAGCQISDRERIERAPTLAREFPQPLQTLTVLTLNHADAHGVALTELFYRNNHIFESERLPVELLLEDALLDLEQSEAGKLYFNGWLVPARGWQLPDPAVLRQLSNAEAREQLNVCVNEVRRLTPDRFRLLNEFKRLQVQLNELLLGQQVLAARYSFHFRYFKYDGTSLTPIIEQRQHELNKIAEQLATQESIMGGRIALGLKLFGQDSAEIESLHRALDFLGAQEKNLYRLEQDTYLLEQLLLRKNTLRETGHTDAINRLTEKVQDAAMRALNKLTDAPSPPDRRYAPMRDFIEEGIDVSGEHTAAVAQRARSVLEGFYLLNEKLSMLAAEQASSVEDAYKIERIRLVNSNTQ